MRLTDLALNAIWLIVVIALSGEMNAQILLSSRNVSYVANEPEISTSNPYVIKFDTIYLTSFTELRINYPGQAENCSICKYKVDAGDEMIYKGPFHLKEQGSHFVLYGAGSLSRSMQAVVDNEGPLVDLEWKYNSVRLGTWEQQKIGNKFDSGHAKEIVCPKGTSLTVTSSDFQVGLKSIEYSINKAPYQDYTGPIRLLAKGKLSIMIRTIDLLGNVTEIELDNFLIK